IGATEDVGVGQRPLLYTERATNLRFVVGEPYWRLVMAQENTAVNALISRSQNKPLEGSEPADDLFKEPPRPKKDTRQTVKGHALPPPYRNSASHKVQGTPAPELLHGHPEIDHTPLPP